MINLGAMISNLTDYSVDEYKSELLVVLQAYLKAQKNEKAMSDYQLHINGRNEMLEEVIAFIDKN